MKISQIISIQDVSPKKIFVGLTIYLVHKCYKRDFTLKDYKMSQIYSFDSFWQYLDLYNGKEFNQNWSTSS